MDPLILILTLLVGFFAGLTLAWFWLDRKIRERDTENEDAWQKRLDHANAEIRRADEAHEETKQRLVEATVAPTTDTGPSPAELAAARERAHIAERMAQKESERSANLSTELDKVKARLTALQASRPPVTTEPAGIVSHAEQIVEPVDDAPDDLKQIKGIGKVLEEKLNALGVTTFSQIATLSDREIERIDEVLDFKGRIAREEWVEQARKLLTERE